MTDEIKDTLPDTELPQTSAAETVPVKEKSAGASKKKGKKRTYRHVPVGHVHIHATYNNTIVSFTDPQGGVLAASSAGVVGFKGPKKSTPYAASIIVKDAAEKVKPYGLTDIAVFVKGVASGREGALRALNTQGFNVSSIKDITPIPHNGCRPKKPRRV
jgi:small subunit ribosomal protein S11